MPVRRAAVVAPLVMTATLRRAGVTRHHPVGVMQHTLGKWAPSNASSPSMLIERQAAVPPLSYAQGPRVPPLLEETIGENLRRTVERFGEREALVVVD
jgi:hypothetical protein